jgi:hypothetical protein
LVTRIIFGDQYRSLSYSLRSFLHSPVTSPLLDTTTLLSTLFSNTLSLRSSLNVRDQVSQHTEQQATLKFSIYLYFYTYIYIYLYICIYLYIYIFYIYLNFKLLDLTIKCIVQYSM